MGTFDGLKLDDHYLHFTFMVVILVVLSGIIELVIHLVSRKVKQLKYRYMADIVNCVYKELMVLGIVGAFLFIANETKALSFAIGSEEESDAVVEFVHFMLFMIGVLYIMLVGFALILVIKSSYRAWGKQEDYAEERDSEAEIPYPTQSTFRWFHPITKFSEYKLRKTISYYHIRSEFISYNNLPPDFDFARYLRKCMRLKIVNMLHINKYMWGFLLLIVLFNAARVASAGTMSTAASVAIGSLLAWILLAVYILIFLYCAHVLWKVIEFHGMKDQAKNIKNLFFLRRPHLVLRALQIATFMQAFYLSLFFLAFAPDIVEDISHSVSWIVFIVTILPPFISVGIFLPQIYPIYVLTCSVHNLSDKKMIEATFKEVIKASRIKSGAFSYAEEWQMEKQWRGTKRILSTVFDEPDHDASPLLVLPTKPQKPQPPIRRPLLQSEQEINPM